MAWLPSSFLYRTLDAFKSSKGDTLDHGSTVVHKLEWNVVLGLTAAMAGDHGKRTGRPAAAWCGMLAC